MTGQQRRPPTWLVDAAKRGVVEAQRALAAFGASDARASSPGRQAARPRDAEHREQAAFFDAVRADPRLAALPIYAVPNFAGHMGKAATRARVGARAKREGRRAGVLDVNVDVAACGFHGLRIEFKADGSLSREQREWVARYQAHGFAVALVRRASVALALLRAYLTDDPAALAPLLDESSPPPARRRA